MNRRQVFTIALLLSSVCVGGVIAIAFQQEQPRPRKVTRVKRPVFTERDWDGIYFEDLFRDGLVGQRPRKIEAAKSVASQASQAESSQAVAESGNAVWSKLIAGFVIEDEIKRINQQLEQDVTSPAKFKSDYAKVRQSYSMLSLMFAVIREYDGDVRWKEFSPKAQVAFARTAANARVGSQQAYQSAKLRKDELADMIRGGGFDSNEEVSDSLEWPLVIDRGALMARLQVSVDTIRPMLANKSEFANNVETIEHEASLIAVMSDVLTREGMDEADEDDYTIYARNMLSAARDVVEGAKTGNFEIASPGYNTVVQSCSNCHEEWR